MDGEPLCQGTDQLFWLLSRATHLPESSLSDLRPDFLVISPPKTGSTWLSANFRCHAQLFVPAIKEIKYFSSLYKWLDLGWYLDHFLSGKGKIKGEASPSYALLPLDRIRLVRSLFPNIKLIYLMRDPISRAWSHARHNFRYREASFASNDATFEEVTTGQWQENFTHPWPLASGDYLGHLQRWLSVFPPQQVFVGFYEEILHQPENLLRRLFSFLGVAESPDLSGFPVRERILAGLDKPLPPGLFDALQSLFHDRSRCLQSYLRESLGLEVPEEWRLVLGSPGSASVSPVAFERLSPAEVLALEEDFPAAHRRLVEDYLGFEIVYYRRQLIALDRSCPGVDLTNRTNLERLQTEGHCHVARSMEELKERIVHFRSEQNARRCQALTEQVSTLGGELERVQQHSAADRQRIAALEHGLWEAGQSVQHLETQLKRLRPWYRILGRTLVNAWHRFSTTLQPPSRSSWNES